MKEQLLEEKRKENKLQPDGMRLIVVEVPDLKQNVVHRLCSYGLTEAGLHILSEHLFFQN